MEKIIISLTSYPDRIQTVDKVICSLFEQNEKADEIVLWLSREEFPKKNEDLPESLKCLVGKNGFRIEWRGGNLKSHKKYYYILQENKNIVITVDDDMYYSKTLVHTLMESYRKHPNAISARNVHMVFKENNSILPYITWESHATEYIGTERMDLCAIGVSGILYPPGCANSRWFDEVSIRTYAENQDDLWLKYNEIIDHIPIVYTGIEEDDILIKESQSNALYMNNAQGGQNDACIEKLVQKMQSNFAVAYQNWFGNLMGRKEFCAKKREYYRLRIKNIISACGGQDLYIYGAGKYAHILFGHIRNYGYAKCIKAFLVSEKNELMSSSEEMEVKSIGELETNTPFSVICGVSERYKKEIRENLDKYVFCNWIDLDIRDMIRLQKFEEKMNMAYEEMENNK